MECYAIDQDGLEERKKFIQIKLVPTSLYSMNLKKKPFMVNTYKSTVKKMIVQATLASKANVK